MSREQVAQLFWRLLGAFQDRFWHCIIWCSNILLHHVEILKQSGQSTVLSLSINLFIVFFFILILSKARVPEIQWPDGVNFLASTKRGKEIPLFS